MALPMGSLVLTLALLSAIQLVCSAPESTYYIRPAPDTPCPAEPCLTLSEYAQGIDHFFTSNTTLVFLPGDHSLDRDVVIANVTRIAVLGDPTSLPEITSRVTCISPAALVFQNISELHLSGMGVSFCGNDDVPAILVSSVSQCEITYSSLQESQGTSLLA